MADLQHRENEAFTVTELSTPRLPLAKLDSVSSDADRAITAQEVSQSGASGVHTAGSTSQELPKMNAALQIKNFPAELLAQLKAAAAISRCTLGDYVTNVLRENMRNLQSPADVVAEAEPRTASRRRAGSRAR